MSKQQVTVPDIGGAEGAEVIEVLVAVGDSVAVDQGLIVLESDKASMEIPSTVAGTVVEVLVAEGQELAEGAPVAVIDAAAAVEQAATEDSPETESVAPVEPPAKQTAAEAPEPATQPNEAASTAAAAAPRGIETPVPAATPAAAGGVYAGPAVRKLARELGVQLEQVSGSGPRGRVVKEDLQQFVRKALSEGASATAGGGAIPAIPEIDFAKFGAVDVTERSKLDKLTAANMQRSWLNVPHVTQFDDVDITALEEFRKGLKAEGERRGTRLTPMPFILKACAVALRDNPKFNSSLAGQGSQLVYKQYIHIGMAVDTPAGLMVPVIRDVDRKTVWELAAEVLDLAARARDRKLMPAEMQGGCFTISSLGSIGGNGFTPIVNAPEVGILGVSRAAIKPVWNGAEFVPRTLLPLALSYDHRVINGGDGGRFMASLVTLLGDLRQLVM
ncbi:MAG: 2-oxo acid dehydrogenase subunit E2 [Gammaproteobacteria bacterium]|nr:2-oxo acid dehydrogenase subunit E2 [Gammaproteobacteria bacterium]